MRLHHILFLLLVLLLPSQLGRHFWPQFAYIHGLRVDYLAPTIYLTDILVFLILFLWYLERPKKFSIFSASWRIQFSVIFLYLFFNSLLAKNQGAAIYKSFKIIEFVLLGFYVSKAKIKLSTFYFLLSAATFYSCLIAFGQFFKQSSLGGIFWWLGERTFTLSTPGIAKGVWQGRFFLRPYSTFSHPNSLSGFVLVSLILVSPFIFKKKKIYSYFLLLTSCFALIVSYSLTVGATVVILSLLTLSFLFFKKKKTILVFLLMISIFFFLALVFQVKPEGESLFLREELNKAALHLIKVAPVFGVGLNNFIPEMSKQKEFLGQIYFLQPVHNIFLLVASETGIVGFFLFTYFLAKTFKRLFLIKNWFLAFSLLPILIIGMVDHYWLTLQQNQLLLTIVFGLAWQRFF